MKKLLLIFTFLTLGMMNANARSIQGKCTDEVGTPIPDVEISVTLRALVGEQPEKVYSDAQGNYIIELPDDYYGDMIYYLWAIRHCCKGTFYNVGGNDNIPLSEDVTIVDIKLKFSTDCCFVTQDNDYRLEYLILDEATSQPIPDAEIIEYQTYYYYDQFGYLSQVGDYVANIFFTDEIGSYTTENRYQDAIDAAFIHLNPKYVVCRATGYEKKKLDTSNYPWGNAGVEQFVVQMKRKLLSDDAGIVDGINTVNTVNTTTKHYGLNGVEVSPTAKGIHIVNGKKVIVR